MARAFAGELPFLFKVIAAAVLACDPGFEDLGFGPGVTGGASYALVRAGTFVLDVCVDVSASTTGTFGSAGIGVNIN